MRIGNYYDYGKSVDFMSNIKKIDDEGLVRKIDAHSVVSSKETEKSSDDESKQELNNNLNDRKQQLISTEEVINKAINKDMKVDKSLIGSRSSLENLDVMKAISTMQKDSILKEYQSFVNDPGMEDGVVIKIK